MARRRRWSFWMSPLEHNVIRLLDDGYRGLLMPMGRALFWGALAAALLLLGGVVTPLVVIFSFCSGALICALAVTLPFRPRLTLSRRMSPPPSAGDVLTYDVLVENTSARTARNIVVEERGLPAEIRPVGEPPLIESLAPGERAVVSLKLSCGLRGAYSLAKLQASSCFPAALLKIPRRAAVTDRLLVYPRFTPLDGFDVPMGRNYQPGGIPVASQVGESTEFLGAREYREGDRLRDVHWPSFARTGKLVVKEFQEEYFARLALVLDIETRSRDDEALFEKSLSLAAGIADALARREYIIDLFAAGSGVFHFQAGRALAHFDNILELLACLEPGDKLDVGALEAAIVPHAGQLSAVIFVLMDWDDRRAAVVQKLKAHGVAVRVLSVRPGKRPTELSPEELVEVA